MTPDSDVGKATSAGTPSCCFSCLNAYKEEQKMEHEEAIEKVMMLLRQIVQERREEKERKEAELWRKESSPRI